MLALHPPAAYQIQAENHTGLQFYLPPCSQEKNQVQQTSLIVLIDHTVSFENGSAFVLPARVAHSKLASLAVTSLRDPGYMSIFPFCLGFSNNRLAFFCPHELKLLRAQVRLQLEAPSPVVSVPTGQICGSSSTMSTPIEDVQVEGFGTYSLLNTTHLTAMKKEVPHHHVEAQMSQLVSLPKWLASQTQPSRSSIPESTKNVASARYPAICPKRPASF